MYITDLELTTHDLVLNEPYTIAYETVDRATNIILRLYTDKGYVGRGCAAPDPVVTGEEAATLLELAQKVLPQCLRGANPFHYSRLLAELKPQLGPAALAMVDMALYDLVAQQAGVPLYQFLGGYRDRILTSITIGVLPVADTLQKASTYLQSGFRILKLKGGLDVETDIAKLVALRRAYPELPLRFDANQGYDLATALHFVKETAPLQLGILEQPVALGKEALLVELIQATQVPVMADESLKTLHDAFRLTSRGYSDMVNIKLMKVGGILNAQHINSVAKAADNEVMVGCLDECSLGIAAGLHFALSRPNVEFADLDGHLDMQHDPFQGLFHLQDGCWVPNGKAGLG